MEVATSPAPKWTERPPWKHAFEIVAGVFQGLLLVYLGLLLVEALRPGTVTKFLQINYILLAVVATGVISVLTSQPQPVEEKPLRKRDYVLVASLALVSFFVLWIKLDDLKDVRWPISIIGGVLIGAVSLSVLLPEKPKPAGTPKTETVPTPTPEKPAISAPPKPASTARPPLTPTVPPRLAKAEQVGVSQWRFQCPMCNAPGRVSSLGKTLTCPRCKTRVTPT